MQREPHPEGVDAATARDQQALAGTAEMQQRQPQETGHSRRGDGHRAAGEVNAPEVPESERLSTCVHIPSNPGAPSCAPSCRGRLPASNYDDVQPLAHARVRACASHRHPQGWRALGRTPAPSVKIGVEIGSDDVEKATRRGNYESGSDYVLEYGELRFSFNEQDFAQRVEQAAVKLDFVDGGLENEELVDLLELAVNGEIREPSSELGEHINEHWTELVGPANRSLVHWIRRLVFRGAWLDQRVKEGELDVVFDPDTHTFGYVQPERDAEPIELSREPSWARLAYRR